MMRYFAKRAAPGSQNGHPGAVKRVKVWGTRDPEHIVCFNCNGLLARLQNQSQRKELLTFLIENTPDVFCLSEVRAAAYCSDPKAKKNDGKLRLRYKASEGDQMLLDAFIREPAVEPYKAYFSLADYRYAGTAVFLRQEAIAQPTAVRYNIDLTKGAKKHQVEGRVIFMEWPGLSLLHTYAPNNGGSEISWLKRRTWDADVKRFLSDDVHEGKNLIWCGDLNVSPTDSDLSHPEFFRRQFHGEQKDRKRFPEYVGQAGCTDRERELFQEILDTAKMVDLYRYKHPSNTGGIQDPLYSWRGGEGKYHCKGMRIDHFIGTTNLLERIEDVSIEGRGTQRLGFIGSDHSPISIHIRGADGDPKTGKEEDTSAKDEQITHAKESEHLGLHQDPL